MNLTLSKGIRKKFGLADIVTANNAFAHGDDLIGLLTEYQKYNETKCYLCF